MLVFWGGVNHVVGQERRCTGVPTLLECYTPQITINPDHLSNPHKSSMELHPQKEMSFLQTQMLNGTGWPMKPYKTG